MPNVNGKYVSPTWHDNAPPALDAAELQAMTDAIAGSLQAEDALSAATRAMFGLGADAVPDDVLAILSKAILSGDNGYTDVNGVEVPQIKIETGSYVGTGTYGENNKNTLNFSGSVKAVFITSNEGSPSTTALIYGNSRGWVIYNSSGAGSIYLVWAETGNALSWYADSTRYQLNESGTYRYIAFLE